MKRKIGLSLIILAAISTTACSSMTGKNGLFRDRTQNYLTATSIKPLTFPPGVSSNQVQSYYPVPSTDNTPQDQAVSVLPPDLWPQANNNGADKALTKTQMKQYQDAGSINRLAIH